MGTTLIHHVMVKQSKRRSELLQPLRPAGTGEAKLRNRLVGLLSQ